MLFLLLINVVTGLLFSLYAALKTKKEHFSSLLLPLGLTLVFPSIGFGLWVHRKKILEKEKHLQEVPYYVFNRMSIVHAAFILVTLFVSMFWFWIMGEEDWGGAVLAMIIALIFSAIYIFFLIIGLILFIVAPFFFAETLLKKQYTDDLMLDEVIDMNEWERAKPPEDKKNLSYDVDDEYISLEDDDNEIIIDLD